MPIGTSDGKLYNDEFDFTLDSVGSLSNLNYGPASQDSNFEQMGMSNPQPLATALTDKTDPDFPIIMGKHDVPLGAAALDNGYGKYAGTVVDRRVPQWTNIDDVGFNPGIPVSKHEAAEHPEMERLINQHGYSDLDAYSQAHDTHGTPADKAWVEDLATKNNKDPAHFWQAYQTKWKSWVDQAQAQDPTDVHPHTYIKPYQPEARQKMSMLMPKKPAQPGPDEIDPYADSDMIKNPKNLNKGKLPPNPEQISEGDTS